MLLVSSSVNASLKNCSVLLPFQCQLLPYQFQCPDPQFQFFCLQFAIDIAEHSFLFCQGAFKSLLCLTTLPACLVPSLSIFRIVIHVHRVPVTLIIFDLYQGCVIHPHGYVAFVMWTLVTVRLWYAFVHGRCDSFF